MITPVRNAYAQRVRSRLAAGARNVAEMAEPADIEALAESKRTGAQEESLLHDGMERRVDARGGEPDGSGSRTSNEQFASVVGQSLRFDERLRATIEAYRYTLDKLDRQSQGQRLKPGGLYDAPL